MQKQVELCRGKTKTVYNTGNPDPLVLEFRNDTSTGGSTHIERSDCKGMVNNKSNYFAMGKLAEADIPTQMERLFSDTEYPMKKLNMVPIEYIAHNRAADPLVKCLGIEEGTELNLPPFDLSLENDAMHDPMVSESYCEAFGWVSKEGLARMRGLTYEANDVLRELFGGVGLILVDFKPKFGLYEGEVVLSDEFSPDGSRLQDKKILEKMDKDRFRQSLDGPVEAYETVVRRPGVQLD